MRVITVSNFKGGVGKTTTAVNLAALCARRGLRTLLVDLDPQASATDYFGLYAEAESGANVIGLLYEGMSVEEMAYGTATENLEVVPASLALIDQNELLLAEQSLKFALDDASGDYDVAIIDTAPSAKQLVLCAYVATSGRGDVVIPVKLDSTVMRGTASVVDSLRLVAGKMRIPVPEWRILRTCVPGRMTNAEAVGEAILDRFFPGKQFATVIHESAKVKEGSWSWEPIVEYMPENRAARDYADLGRELGLWGEQTTSRSASAWPGSSTTTGSRASASPSRRSMSHRSRTIPPTTPTPWTRAASGRWRSQSGRMDSPTSRWCAASPTAASR